MRNAALTFLGLIAIFAFLLGAAWLEGRYDGMSAGDVALRASIVLAISVVLPLLSIPTSEYRKLPRALLRLAPYIAIVNFFVFGAIAVSIGGDALSGRAVDGHYFVSEQGRLTEVSRAIFAYSWWHEVITFVLLPLGFLARAIDHHMERVD